MNEMIIAHIKGPTSTVQFFKCLQLWYRFIDGFEITKVGILLDTCSKFFQVALSNIGQTEHGFY